MQPSRIRQFNHLNQQFYTKVAASFTATRQKAWPGWQQLCVFEGWTEHNHPHTILDIGAGNGRFVQYMNDICADAFSYTAWDTSPDFLNEITQRTVAPNHTVTTLLYDVVEAALTQTLPTTTTYDLIVLFGVLHHIPGDEVRQHLLTWMHSVLSPTGCVCISTWNFPQKKQLIARAHSEQHLDQNDYVLDWQKDERAKRYCHFVSEEEMTLLCQRAKLKIQKTWRPEQGSDALNQYWVLRR